MSSLPLEEVRHHTVDHHLTDCGDVILILSHPCTKFAVDDEEKQTPSKAVKIEDTVDSHQVEGTRVNEEDNCNEVSYRVSSHCLSQASPYFKKMFTGDWAEGTSLRHGNGVKLTISEPWDPSALLLILEIAHLHFTKVPAKVELDQLGKIVVIADYLQCVELLSPFSEKWHVAFGDPWNMLLSTSKKDAPLNLRDQMSIRDATVWAFVSWKLLFRNFFNKATITLVLGANRPVQSLGLPLDTLILDMLNREREDRLHTFFNVLTKTEANLRKSDKELVTKPQHLVELLHLGSFSRISRNRQKPFNGVDLTANLRKIWYDGHIASSFRLAGTKSLGSIQITSPYSPFSQLAEFKGFDIEDIQ